MAFPLFRNGKLLFCQGGLATKCCQDDPEGPDRLYIDLTGAGVYHKEELGGDNGCYVAVEVYDDNGNLVGQCGQTSFTLPIFGQRTYTIRWHMMAWHGTEGVPLSWFTVGLVAKINAGRVCEKSMTLDGATTETTASGCRTLSGSLFFTITADPLTETVT